MFIRWVLVLLEISWNYLEVSIQKLSSGVHHKDLVTWENQPLKIDR